MVGPEKGLPVGKKRVVGWAQFSFILNLFKYFKVNILTDVALLWYFKDVSGYVTAYVNFPILSLITSIPAGWNL